MTKISQKISILLHYCTLISDKKKWITQSFKSHIIETSHCKEYPLQMPTNKHFLSYFFKNLTSSPILISLLST